MAAADLYPELEKTKKPVDNLLGTTSVGNEDEHACMYVND